LSNTSPRMSTENPSIGSRISEQAITISLLCTANRFGNVHHVRCGGDPTGGCGAWLSDWGPNGWYVVFFRGPRQGTSMDDVCMPDRRSTSKAELE
jgi:hypothetical protein